MLQKEFPITPFAIPKEALTQQAYDQLPGDLTTFCNDIIKTRPALAIHGLCGMLQDGEYVINPQLWDDDVKGTLQNQRTALAKLACGLCPVRATCLKDALRQGDDASGVRGGMTSRERIALLKRQALAKQRLR